MFAGIAGWVLRWRAGRAWTRHAPGPVAPQPQSRLISRKSVENLRHLSSAVDGKGLWRRRLNEKRLERLTPVAAEQLVVPDVRAAELARHLTDEQVVLAERSA